MELQRLELSDYRSGTKAQKIKFANGLVTGFSTRGFVKIDNHEFDEDSVREMFEWVCCTAPLMMESN